MYSTRLIGAFTSSLRLPRPSSIRTIRSPLRASRLAPTLFQQSFHTTQRMYATSPSSISPSDPALIRAQDLLEEGTRALEDGDMDAAKAKYEESLKVMPTSGAWFNLGVCAYQLGKIDQAISHWRESITLEPSSDAYTNIGSAYMMARPSKPAEAIKALTSAMELSPEDPEIQFNLAAILESTDKLETALELYRRAHAGGIERAATNIRNLGGKILARQLAAKQND